jgi:hypothetical protein
VLIGLAVTKGKEMMGLMGGVLHPMSLLVLVVPVQIAPLVEVLVMTGVHLKAEM